MSVPYLLSSQMWCMLVRSVAHASRPADLNALKCGYSQINDCKNDMKGSHVFCLTVALGVKFSCIKI